jgi:membrane-bound lytic murein transglycosylase D
MILKNMRTNQLDKTQMKTQFKTKFKLSLLGLIAASLMISHTPIALAEMNAAGVEIEVITDLQLDNNLSAEADQEPTTNIEVTDSAQADEQGDLWARIKDGYAMPDVASQYATNHENWYAARPDYVKRMVDRSQKYLFHIVEEVQKRDMPTEIALLPMVESAFNPQANSTSKASGIWQFMPATGKHFGLKQTWWIDNRRDVTAATDAALTYLQKLHGMFGSWDLALAAYNSGEGTVSRAIERNRAAGLPTDYAHLDLPLETKNYVPKLQAIKNIISDPARFGLQLSAIPNRPYFARVTTPKQIDSKLAAQLAEISYDEFSALNPSYNRPVITSQGEKHQLLLPVWAAERFADNLANYDKPLTTWQTYNAKRGEIMASIAEKFGIDVGQLGNVNGLTGHTKLKSARAMLVPVAFSADAANTEENTINASEMENNNTVIQADNDEPKKSAENEPKFKRTVILKVKKGDTLINLAKEFNTDVKTISANNHLKNGQIKIGQGLRFETWSKVDKKTVAKYDAVTKKESNKAQKSFNRDSNSQNKHKTIRISARKSLSTHKAKTSTVKAHTRVRLR